MTFENLEELNEALAGDWGPEFQADAEQVAAEINSGIEADEQEAAQIDQERWAGQFAEEAEHSEQRLGRQLSDGEIDVLIDDAARSAGPLDLDDSYTRLINRDVRNNDDHAHDYMAEVFEEEQAKPDPREAAAAPEAEAEEWEAVE